MHATPINAAEAVFELFYDPKLSGLPHWTIAPGGARGLRLGQFWSWVQFDWEEPPAAGPALRISRRFDLPCADYDRLLVSMLAPAGATVTVIAATDRGERRMTSAPFDVVKRELALPLEGAAAIREITLEVHSSRPGTAMGWFMWIGLQHSGLLARHLAQFDRFDARWEGYLQPENYEPKFVPAYGLHLTAGELEALRADPAAMAPGSPLDDLAADAQRLVPERMIYDYVNFWNDTRVCRERDIGKHLLTHGANAAQAGMLRKDKALCRLAARYAMSLAHCGRWDGAFMVNVTGSAWEQRAFVPSLCLYDCAFILDLCGEWFTDLGRIVLLRRFADEGQGANLLSVWRWEYIFHCNQLAWFMPGRLLSLLVLERTMPEPIEGHPRPAHSRVAPYTELALAELRQNLDLVLLPDGGYTEGPSYFTWTARQAFISYYYYARARGADLRALLPPAMRATANLAEMLVSTDEGAIMILICDAFYLNQESLAFLAWFMPDSHWVTAFHNSLRRSGGQPNSILAYSLRREIPAAGPAFRPFLAMPDIGMMCSLRELGGEKVKLFLMGNQAGASHTHEDKGSFVLEFAGDSFAMDFGSMDYSNPMAEILKHAQRHNMLAPDAPGGERPRPKNPVMADLRHRGEGDAVRFRADLDLTPGWEGWYRRWHRSWDSPTPAELTIVDEWEIERGRGVAFYWTSPLPMALDAARRRVVITGRRAQAVITYPEDCDAVIEQLPLLAPAQRAINVQRREMLPFLLDLGETQPRLALTQRGRSGRLEVRVALSLLPRPA